MRGIECGKRMQRMQRMRRMRMRRIECGKRMQRMRRMRRMRNRRIECGILMRSMRRLRRKRTRRNECGKKEAQNEKNAKKANQEKKMQEKEHIDTEVRLAEEWNSEVSKAHATMKLFEAYLPSRKKGWCVTPNRHCKESRRYMMLRKHTLLSPKPLGARFRIIWELWFRGSVRSKTAALWRRIIREASYCDLVIPTVVGSSMSAYWGIFEFVFCGRAPNLKWYIRMRYTGQGWWFKAAQRGGRYYCYHDTWVGGGEGAEFRSSAILPSSTTRLLAG